MSEVSNLFVVLMGTGTVFVGLICIVILCMVMSLICKVSDHAQPTPSAPVAAAPAAVQVVENRQEIIAAVSAAAAEELGTDISAIRVLSFKKL